MTMRSRAVLAAFAAVSVAVLAACGSTASPSGGSGGDSTSAAAATPSGPSIAAPDANGALAKAAKKEGQLVWYAPALGGITDLGAAFTKKYGVKVNIVQQ